MCPDCGTDHDGLPLGSFGATMMCLRLRALRELSGRAALDFDKSWQRVRDVADVRRDEILRRYFSDEIPDPTQGA